MRTLFAALVPGYTGEPVPRAFPWPVRLLLRLSVLVATWAALRAYCRPFGALAPDQREAVLERLAHHPWAPLRGVLTWWKLCALLSSSTPTS